MRKTSHRHHPCTTHTHTTCLQLNFFRWPESHEATYLCYTWLQVDQIWDVSEAVYLTLSEPQRDDMLHVLTNSRTVMQRTTCTGLFSLRDLQVELYSHGDTMPLHSQHCCKLSSVANRLADCEYVHVSLALERCWPWAWLGKGSAACSKN